MLTIDDALKDLYKQRNIPKSLSIYFPGIGLTINNDKLVSESMEISEQICSSNDLEFGACEASVIKFTCANIIQDLTDQDFIITQTVGDYTMPLGTYRVASCEKKNDRWFRDVVAYDSMKKTDVDVTAWYNSLTFPITVKNMKLSLLTHLGLEYENQTLINDDVELAKTVNPAQLLGRDVLKRLCQLHGGFGHFTRLNKFKVIQLSNMGLYPSETLCPVEDLFPAESGELLTAGYKSIHYEEYIVEPISKLQISQEDGDEGVVVGTGDNTYVLSENFLLYGKTAAELEVIANNVLLQIRNKYYRPHNTVMVGLPYLEVGDTLTIITSNDAIETFIFQRTLKGIQALEDTITATGSQKRSNNVGLSIQIAQLKGRALKITKTVDKLSSDMTNLEENVSSQIEQTVESIALKVDAAGVISAINLSPETVKIEATNIQFEGLVTANSNFKILLDGSIEAVNGKFSGTITASSISGSSFYQTGSQGTVTIQNGWIDTDVMTAVAIGASSILVDSSIALTGSTGTVQATNLNGTNGNIGALTVTTIGNGLSSGSPIHAGNISGQSVNYATTAGSANNCIYATNAGSANSVPGLATGAITATNTGYGNIDFQGFDNAAGVNWAQATFVLQNPSDIRLKWNISNLDNIPDDLFYSLKVKQFKYKTPNIYGDGISFGLIAQEVESAFQNYGLNPYDYDLIEVKDVSAYTDDAYYVNDATHRIHYNNLIAWLINIVQKQNARISQLEKL